MTYIQASYRIFLTKTNTMMLCIILMVIVGSIAICEDWCSVHSPPAVASWGTNRLDIFGLGEDNAMYHKALMVIVGFHL